MISKKQAQIILDSIKDDMISILELQEYKINWLVLHSTKKATYKMGVRIHNTKGCTFTNYSKSADILIFHDHHFTKRDLIATIFHELLHVRFSYISNLVTMNLDKMYRQEEKLVRIFEKIFLKCVYDKIKKRR